MFKFMSRKTRLINELRELLNQYTDENIELKRKLADEAIEKNKEINKYEVNINVLRSTLLEIKEICKANEKKSKLAKKIIELIPLEEEKEENENNKNRSTRNNRTNRK